METTRIFHSIDILKEDSEARQNPNCQLGSNTLF